jgi:hypothetical protein
MKAYIIFAVLVIIWVSTFCFYIHQDYKHWPDIPGINCINLDDTSIWPVHTSYTNR